MDGLAGSNVNYDSLGIHELKAHCYRQRLHVTGTVKDLRTRLNDSRYKFSTTLTNSSTSAKNYSRLSLDDTKFAVSSTSKDGRESQLTGLPQSRGNWAIISSEVSHSPGSLPGFSVVATPDTLARNREEFHLLLDHRKRKQDSFQDEDTPDRSQNKKSRATESSCHAKAMCTSTYTQFASKLATAVNQHEGILQLIIEKANIELWRIQGNAEAKSKNVYQEAKIESKKIHDKAKTDSKKILDKAEHDSQNLSYRADAESKKIHDEAEIDSKQIKDNAEKDKIVEINRHLKEVDTIQNEKKEEDNRLTAQRTKHEKETAEKQNNAERNGGNKTSLGRVQTPTGSRRIIHLPERPMSPRHSKNLSTTVTGPGNWRSLYKGKFSDTPILPNLRRRQIPHVFVSTSSVPMHPDSMTDLVSLIRQMEPKEVKADKTGYFFIFDTRWGNKSAKKCFEKLYKHALQGIHIIEPQLSLY